MSKASIFCTGLSASGPQTDPPAGEDGDLVVAEGSSLTIKCLPPSGLPTPEVTWAGVTPASQNIRYQ